GPVVRPFAALADDRCGTPVCQRGPAGPAGDRQRLEAGPRQASTKNANSRSNALGVDSVRSGWHWTAMRNGPLVDSNASTSSPSGPGENAAGTNRDARSLRPTPWWW